MYINTPASVARSLRLMRAPDTHRCFCMLRVFTLRDKHARHKQQGDVLISATYGQKRETRAYRAAY